MVSLNVWFVEVVELIEQISSGPAIRGLAVVATTDDCRRFQYTREFRPNELAHAEYFAQLVRNTGRIDSDHWSETK